MTSSVATGSDLLDQAATVSSHSDMEGRSREDALWFISLRWIAVVVAAVFVVLAVHALHLLPETVWIPLLSVVAALAALNLLYLVLAIKEVRPSLIIALQAYFDLGLLTILIHFSGGIENPLVLLMIFHVIIAGITLSRSQCYQVAVVASLLFGLLAWLEASELVEHYTLRIVPHYGEHGGTAHAAHDPVYVVSFVILQATILLLTAFFVTTLADRLRQKEAELGILADRALTQRKLLEQSLDTTGAGLLVCDRDLRPVLASHRWRAWFRDGEHGGPADEPLSMTLKDGVGRVSEIELSSRKGADIPSGQIFQITTAALSDSDAHVTHVVQLARDITEQTEAQRQMIRASQLAAVGELAGQVAHEVNNPVAIINAKSRLLLTDHRADLSSKTVSELEKIVDLSDRVASIAGGLLSYCRPTGASRTDLDVSIPVRRAISMVEQRATSTGIAIADEMRDPLPLVHANGREIEQVFLNLFLNAIDAMPDGGRLTVFAEVSGARGTLTISVRDTGKGIPRAVVGRIFEPFFTTKPEGKGTGLGLSVCQGLVQNHGGVIEVESTEDRGTVFNVRLPLSVSSEVLL